MPAGVLTGSPPMCMHQTSVFVILVHIDRTLYIVPIQWKEARFILIWIQYSLIISHLVNEKGLQHRESLVAPPCGHVLWVLSTDFQQCSGQETEDQNLQLEPLDTVDSEVYLGLLSNCGSRPLSSFSSFTAGVVFASWICWNFIDPFFRLPVRWPTDVSTFSIRL